MKRAVIVFSIIMLTVSCGKNKFEPEGPTDVRIYNNTDKTFENVVVITSDSEDYDDIEFTFGTVASGTYTEYHRFDIAYPEADISLTIDGIEYSTPATSFDYLPYIGQDRITYRVDISDDVNHILEIHTILEEPIDDL